MRAAVAIAQLEVRRRVRDRSLLIQGVLGPILLAGIIGLAFGGGGGGNFDVALGLVDDDGSVVSIELLKGLRSFIEQAPEDERPPVTVTDVSSAEAASVAVDDGDLDAALVVPEGFGAAVLGGAGAPSLEVLTTNSRRISGDIAASVAEQLAASLDATRLGFATAAAIGAATPQEVIQPTLDLAEEPVGGDFDAVAFFAPSMAILFLFFTVGAGARSLLHERTDGTLARVRAAPVADRSILAGKALAVLVAGLVSLAVVWGVTSTVFGASWGQPVGVALVLVGVVVAVSGIAALLAGLARTEAQAESTTSAAAFVLALIGGNFVPPGALPPLFERLSLLTPNGWALRALTELSAGEATAGDVAPTVGVLLAMGAVTALAGTAMLRRSLA